MAALLLVCGCLLAGCGGGMGGESTRLGPRIVELGQPVPKGGGVYKVGAPYRINGQVYRPREMPGYVRAGVASWYGELFHGRRTANGEIYDMEALTAAHPTLPLPSYVRVVNPRNGRSLVLRVNDRGPYAGDREIDLSWAAATLLEIARPGTGLVQVEYLGPARLDGDDSYERQMLARQSWAGSRVAFAKSPAKALVAQERRYSLYETQTSRYEDFR
jgi:rare lipoprotein A